MARFEVHLDNYKKKILNIRLPLMFYDMYATTAKELTAD